MVDKVQTGNLKVFYDVTPTFGQNTFPVISLFAICSRLVTFSIIHINTKTVDSKCIIMYSKHNFTFTTVSITICCT